MWIGGNGKMKLTSDLKVLVIGRGEIGSPIFDLISKYYCTKSYDLLDGDPVKEKYDVIHICFPYSTKFENAVLEYAKLFEPSLILIESTVAPGTTRNIDHALKKTLGIPLLVHSPVRGRTADTFQWAFLAYTKYIGPISEEAGKVAKEYYESMGLKTRVCETPEDTEWAKILNTSYWGIILAWYQEVERICTGFNLDSLTIISFFGSTQAESAGKIPRPVIWTGTIGGHCIIPNARLLLSKYDSNFVADIIRSQMTFETSMKSLFMLGEKEGCPLCERIYTREIYRNVSSEPFCIIQCLSCRVPMVVFRSHEKPSKAQMDQAIKTASQMFPSYKLDFSLGAIPQHPHFHIRKVRKMEQKEETNKNETGKYMHA